MRRCNSSKDKRERTLQGNTRRTRSAQSIWPSCPRAPCVDRAHSREADCDGFHSVRFVTNAPGEPFHQSWSRCGLKEDSVAHEPLPAAVDIVARRWRVELLLAPAGPACRGKRRPGAPRPHGDRLARRALGRRRRSRAGRRFRANSLGCPLRDVLHKREKCVRNDRKLRPNRSGSSGASGRHRTFIPSRVTALPGACRQTTAAPQG